MHDVTTRIARPGKRCILAFAGTLIFSVILAAFSVRAQTVQYHFPGTQPVHAPQSDSSFQYAYDLNGNVQAITGSTGVTIYHYNTLNKLRKVEKDGQAEAEYLYGVNGVRMAKTDAQGNVTERYYGETEITEAGTTRYYFVGSKRVAKRNSAGSLSFVHQDHLGSASAITDGNSGQSLLSRQYYEFGAIRTVSGTQNDPHAYNDKRLDLQTGLYDYEARSYAAKSFRFVQPDTIIPNPGSPQSFNRYAYVENNPLKYVDPTGHALRLARVSDTSAGRFEKYQECVALTPRVEEIQIAVERKATADWREGKPLVSAVGWMTGMSLYYSTLATNFLDDLSGANGPSGQLGLLAGFSQRGRRAPRTKGKPRKQSWMWEQSISPPLAYGSRVFGKLLDQGKFPMHSAARNKVIKMGPVGGMPEWAGGAAKNLKEWLGIHRLDNSPDVTPLNSRQTYFLDSLVMKLEQTSSRLRSRRDDYSMEFGTLATDLAYQISREVKISRMTGEFRGMKADWKVHGPKSQILDLLFKIESIADHVVVNGKKGAFIPENP